MLKLGLIDNIYNSLEVSHYFDMSKIRIEGLALATQKSYLLKIIISKQAGLYYEKIKTDKKAGVRLQYKDFDIAFIQTRQAVENASGELMLELESWGVHNITYISPRLNPLVSSYSGLASGLLNQITNSVKIKLVSSDQNINLITSIGSNYDLMLDVMKSTFGWTFREGNIEDNLAVIEVGNFRNLPTEGIISNREGADFDTLGELVGVPELKTNDNRLSHVLPVGKIGGDDSNNVYLTTPSFGTLPGFDLVDLGTRNSKNEKVLYVKNKEVNTNKIDFYFYETATSQEDTTYNKEISQQDLYLACVNFIKSKDYTEELEVSYQLNRILLPGTRIDIDINLKDFKNKSEKYIYNIEYNTDDFLRYVSN